MCTWMPKNMCCITSVVEKIGTRNRWIINKIVSNFTFWLEYVCNVIWWDVIQRVWVFVRQSRLFFVRTEEWGCIFRIKNYMYECINIVIIISKIWLFYFYKWVNLELDKVLWLLWRRSRKLRNVSESLILVKMSDKGPVPTPVCRLCSVIQSNSRALNSTTSPVSIYEYTHPRIDEWMCQTLLI